MAANLQCIPVRFLKDNYAWLISDGTHAIVVDPGAVEPVEEYCKSRGLVIIAVLPTLSADMEISLVVDVVVDGSSNGYPILKRGGATLF